jgi:preprotein translocase subunit SecB
MVKKDTPAQNEPAAKTEADTTKGVPKGAPKGESANAQPTSDRQLVVHAQYVKDFSFENPNAPKVLTENLGQPDVEISVSVGAKLIDENQYEVVLNLGAKAVVAETPMFLVDLTYAGLVSPQEVAGDDIDPLIMIEAPRLLFPFARALISDATRDGGFMPLNIQPVDFVAVYKHNLERQAAAAAEQPAN